MMVLSSSLEASTTYVNLEPTVQNMQVSPSQEMSNCLGQVAQLEFRKEIDKYLKWSREEETLSRAFHPISCLQWRYMPRAKSGFARAVCCQMMLNRTLVVVSPSGCGILLLMIDITYLLSPLAWMPPPVSRVQYRSCMVRMYQRRVAQSNSNWKVS